jgi:hypothetical protein
MGKKLHLYDVLTIEIKSSFTKLDLMTPAQAVELCNYLMQLM